MFFDLMRRDTILLSSIVIFFVLLLFFLKVLVTKTISTRRSYFELSNKAYKITLTILSIIILSCLITFSYKIFDLLHLVRNGIRYETIILNIEEVERSPLRGRRVEPTFLRIFYSYSLEGIEDTGSANIFDRSQKQNYRVGGRIIIIIDPNNVSRSILYY